MDKFVTRTPTWKTKTFTTVSSGYRRNSLGGKATPKKELNPKKTLVFGGVLKPLQEQQIECNSNRRLSIRDDSLLKIFASQPDQPLVSEANASDSGCSSSSETFPYAGGEFCRHQLIDIAENTPPDITEKLYTNLNEPTDSSQVASTQQQQSKVLGDNDKVEEELLPCTPENALLATESDLPTTPGADNWLIMRIQRDLNSPSASVRVRALKAMKSPTKSAYQQFDVPHAEQSLVTAEDRRSPKPPKSIQELMEHIIVYVEVRTGEDNRSAGVKKVISALGAKVNDKLLRDTTHVIFKDGLLSTYKKAKNWNIPVVSILWIEACKTQRKICDPSEFPISNIDRYENPELYEKMKRHKSMQPDSEANKRIRVRATTPKNATPKIATPNAAAVKKTSTLIDDTPTSSARRNKKTDISRFFTQLGINKKFPMNFSDWSPCETPATPANSATGFVQESPATVLLNRMNDDDDFCTPLQKAGPNITGKEFIINAADGPEQTIDAKKSLNFVTATLEKTPTKSKRVSIRRRSKLLTPTTLQSTVNNVEDMSTFQTPSKNTNSVSKSKTPYRNTRRSSIHIETRINISNEKDLHGSADKRTRTRQTDFKTIAEIEDESNTKKANAAETTPKRSYKRRQTTYTPRPLEISADKQETEVSRNKGSAKQPAVTGRSAVKRRTLFTPNKIEQSVSDDTLERHKNTIKDKLECNTNRKLSSPHSDTQLYSTAALETLSSFSGDIASSTRYQDDSIGTQTPPPPQPGSLLEQHSVTVGFSSTRVPGRRRTIFDVSMDIITQRLHNINQIARRSLARPSNNDLEIQPNPLEVETTNARAPLETVSSPNLSAQKEQNSKDLKTLHSTQKKLSGTNSELKEVDSSEESTEPAPKKKRKLFVPNESCLATPVTRVASTTALESSSSVTSHTRRRRTLMPLSQPQSESKPATPAVKTARAPRRSTMDFEDMRKVKNSLAKKLQTADTAKTSTIANQNTTVTEVAKPQPQQLTENADAVPNIDKQKPQGAFLVYTNMHREQIEVIKEALTKLGNFQLEDNVTKVTTHIVSLEPRRTLNLLRALLRGLWILEYSWILDSLRAGKWLSEEPYELRDFSRAVQICRSERQAFGSSYKSELFSSLGAFYVSSRCGCIPKENLLELIQLSGGKIADQRKRAKYILGDINRAHEDKVYITPAWILDSITHMQLQKLVRYTSGTTINVATTSQQASKQQNSQNNSDQLCKFDKT